MATANQQRAALERLNRQMAEEDHPTRWDGRLTDVEMAEGAIAETFVRLGTGIDFWSLPEDHQRRLLELAEQNRNARRPYTDTVNTYLSEQEQKS